MKQKIHKRELGYNGDKDYERRVQRAQSAWGREKEENRKNEPCVMIKEESGITSAWRTVWR